MLRILFPLLMTLLPVLALAAPLAENQRLDATVEVKALDDPANPYREQYADWDRWLIANAQPPGIWPTEDQYAGYYVLEGLVDEHGWLLPQVAALGYTAKWYRDMEFNPRKVFTSTLQAGGNMDDDLLRRTRTAFAKARAPFFPAVPKWLTESTPQWSILLPDRTVIAMGDMRSSEWSPPGFMDWMVSDVSAWGWQLLDTNGELIDVTLPQCWWWELTIPDFRERIAEFRKPTMNVIEKYGRIHVYDMQSRQTYANFDWDGTPLQANLKLHEGRDGCPFLGIHGFDLPVIYAEQQRLAARIDPAP